MKTTEKIILRLLLFSWGISLLIGSLLWYFLGDYSGLIQLNSIPQQVLFYRNTVLSTWIGVFFTSIFIYFLNNRGT